MSGLGGAAESGHTEREGQGTLTLCIVFAAICIVCGAVQEYRTQRRRWRILCEMMERENDEGRID